MKKMWRKFVVVLSSFGLLSTFGYYLINLENTTLGKDNVRRTTVSAGVDTSTSHIDTDTLIATVTKIVDGDTIKVKDITNGKVITIRMLGIDTPETAHSPRAKVRGVADCLANEATDAMKELVQGKQVQLETDPSGDTYDKYGRLLAYVFVGEDGSKINTNKKMIANGYAYEYTYRGRKYKYQSEFKNAQKEAEQQKRGLWADGVCE